MKHVQDGSIIGLGSGTTVAHTVQQIGEKVRRENLRVLGVPTSHQVMLLAVSCGVPLTTLDEHPHLSVTIDGADQVDKQLNLIKGMGGALMREKIVASAAKQLVIVVDETKVVERLGIKHPLPVEIMPFALSFVMAKVREFGGKPVLREGKHKVGPVVTDNGNFILDVDFGVIDDPEELDAKLKLVPGVLETGLFPGIADVVYVGGPNGVERLVRK